MMSIYHFGIVYACKVTVRYMPSITNQYGFIQYSNHSVTLPITMPTYDQITELKEDCKSWFQTVYNYNLPPYRRTFYKSIKALESKSELEHAPYYFTGSSGPTYACGVAVGSLNCISTDSTASTCQMVINITYYCKLYDRIIANIAE